MSQITTLTNHRSPQNQPHYFIRTHHLNRRPLCWSHQNKGSINQDCHKRFYRHMFFWFIYFFTFETSATASCGYTGTSDKWGTSNCHILKVILGWIISLRISWDPPNRRGLFDSLFWRLLFGSPNHYIVTWDPMRSEGEKSFKSTTDTKRWEQQPPGRSPKLPPDFKRTAEKSVPIILPSPTCVWINHPSLLNHWRQPTQQPSGTFAGVGLSVATKVARHKNLPNFRYFCGTFEPSAKISLVRKTLYPNRSYWFLLNESPQLQPQGHLEVQKIIEA